MNEIERLKEIRGEFPAARAQAREAARAALMARFDPPARKPDRRRLLRRGYLALAAAVAVVAALFLIVIGSGTAPTGRPGLATAAELRRLAKISPHLVLAAGGWHIIGVETVSKVEGHTEFFLGKPPLDASRLERGRVAEFHWRSFDQRTRSAQLRAAGFELARVARLSISFQARITKHPDRIVQLWVPRGSGPGPLPVIGLWQEDGRAFEFRQFAASLSSFERLVAKLVEVSTTNWIQALNPTFRDGVDTAEITSRGIKGSLWGPSISLKSKNPKLFRRLSRESLEAAGAPLPLIHRDGRVTLNPGWVAIHEGDGQIRVMTRRYGGLWRQPTGDRGEP